MKLFEKNKNKIKPEWVFNQHGNLWKFIFGGKDIIAGETRDIENKKLYLFSLQIENGKKMLSNFLFEDGNYWISTEGANSEVLYLNRFEKPELPYHKNIIALDIKTGEKLWENEEYQYFFSTENKLFGMKQKFESTEISEIDTISGKTIKVFSENEYPALLDLKRRSDDDLYNEYNDYPVSINKYPPENNIHEIILSETGETDGDTEYLIKDNFLLFNYYKEAKPDLKDITRKFYTNVFCIFEIDSRKKIYQDVLNRISSYNVPDNFFSRDNHIFYLREKKDIVAIKI